MYIEYNTLGRGAWLVVVVVLTLTCRVNQVRGHRTDPSISGVEEYPTEKDKQTKSGTRTYHS